MEDILGLGGKRELVAQENEEELNLTAIRKATI